MNLFGLLIACIVIFKGPSSVVAADIPVDEVQDITVLTDDIDDKTISGVDVRNIVYDTEFYRGNWCQIVNAELGKKLRIANRVAENVAPGRGWIYGIHTGSAGGPSEFVYGFVCAAEPKPFLVVMTHYNPHDLKFRAYTPSTRPTIVDYGEQSGDRPGVYNLRSGAR